MASSYPYAAASNTDIPRVDTPRRHAVRDMRKTKKLLPARHSKYSIDFLEAKK